MDIATIGLDLAKNVFQLHALNHSGRTVSIAYGIDDTRFGLRSGRSTGFHFERPFRRVVTVPCGSVMPVA
ncbi:transposase IS116/IS110/IS902 family protein [Burkholderia sp. H160]|nr:transposase IS116/IS110/IS902 family protein [Burkholderia sp. H160]